MDAETVPGRRFRRTWRGYDPSEVDAFLLRVARELQTARQTASDAGERLANVTRELVAARGELQAARRELDELRIRVRLGEARAAAEAEEAERRSAELLAEARRNAASIRAELDRTRALHEETLASLQWEAALAEEQKKRLEAESRVLELRVERLRSALERCRAELSDLLEPL